ncbi:MAG: DUF58 domain-containing protein [Micropruina sp.]|uniref:DUF58 domain-containing protein n=1 Tax=Micropruina sp. TaxID=2737536 RepID=UPI0039E5C5A6
MIRLTFRGLGLVTAAVALLIAAGTTGLRSLAWPGGLLIGLIVAAAVLNWRSARRPDAIRSLVPDRVAAGSTVRASLELRRDSVDLGAWGYLDETVPDGLGDTPTVPVASGQGRRRSRHPYEMETFVRGRYLIGPCLWTTNDPLGLTSRVRKVGGRSLLTVTPAIHPLGPAWTGAGTGLVGEAAQRRSSVLGPDDALIREYRPRDELRRIHWPSTARTGTLMVRREEHAWEPSALILLDNRQAAHVGTGPRSSFEWAVSAAASIGMQLLDAGYEVGLVDAAGHRLDTDGDTAREALLDHLTDSTLTDTGDLGDALHAEGSRAQLLIAILGRLRPADAIALTTARRHGTQCRAIVVQAVESGSTETGLDDPVAILLGNGWQVVANAGVRGIPQAWDALRDGARR